MTNFAEIDAYVLLACAESVAKFWRMEREEMLVPVLTPLELEVALGAREWDGRYSFDYGDLVRWEKEDRVLDEDEDQPATVENAIPIEDENGSSDGDDDAPFFSMISGEYEQPKTLTTITIHNHDLESLPGKGKLIEYKSEAAEFLKKREYRGLEANVGQTEVKAAVRGQVGIASKYRE